MSLIVMRTEGCILNKCVDNEKWSMNLSEIRLIFAGSFLIHHIRVIQEDHVWIQMCPKAHFLLPVTIRSFHPQIPSLRYLDLEILLILSVVVSCCRVDRLDPAACRVSSLVALVFLTGILAVLYSTVNKMYSCYSVFQYVISR